jgi:hypothetical protein
MRRKQSMQHFDQRQILMLENAYYQVRKIIQSDCRLFLTFLSIGSATLPNGHREKRSIGAQWNYLFDT